MPKRSVHPRVLLLRPLTPRERAILRMLAESKTTAEMAAALDCTVRSVRVQAQRVYAKLGITTASEAITRGRALGLLEDGRDYG